VYGHYGRVGQGHKNLKLIIGESVTRIIGKLMRLPSAHSYYSNTAKLGTHSLGTVPYTVIRVGRPE
jgi:hypothetical protein